MNRSMAIDDLPMKCVFCRHGSTRPGDATVTLQRGETVVVVKGVPADICKNCGEYFLSAAVSENVMAKAEAAVENGVEVEIVRYAA